MRRPREAPPSYLGVGTGCRRTAVSQMITDLFDRQAFGKEASRTGMAKGMSAPVGSSRFQARQICDWRHHRCSPPSTADGELACRGRLPGRDGGLQCRCSGPAPRRRMKSADRSAAVGASGEKAEGSDRPSRSDQAAMPQLRHCASRRPQAAAGSHDRNAWACQFGIGQHALHVGPIWGIWQRFLLVEPGSANRRTGDPLTFPALPRSAEILAKRPQCLRPRRATIVPSHW